MTDPIYKHPGRYILATGNRDTKNGTPAIWLFGSGMLGPGATLRRKSRG